MTWIDRPTASQHPAGHKVGLFDDGWWFYPAGYAGPRKPGPQPAGPFKTQEEAKAVLDTFQVPSPRLLEVH